MWDYFKTYYIDMAFGPGYIPTEVIFVTGLVLIFNKVEKTKKGMAYLAGKIAVVWMASVLLSGIYYSLWGIDNLSRNITLLLVAICAALARKYAPTIRVIRGGVYYACYFQSLAMSEPLGEWLKDIFGEDKRWLEHTTWIVVLITVSLVVWMIQAWAIEDLFFVPTTPAVMIIIASVLGIILQYSAGAMDVAKGYKLIVGAAFWLLEIFSYYLFYIVGRESRKNVEFLAMAHKEKLTEEMLHTFRDNLESMRMIRHEIRNHLAYIRVLIAKEEYGKLFDYTNKFLGETEELFSTIDCGNDVVNAVVNHMIQKAKKLGIRVEAQIIVPKVLPFDETDFYSLVSNLMENAMEAAEVSGKENPVIEIRIQPRQDYLFIRVTNPVRAGVPQKRILSLKTTKEDKALHGYGTKVVRNIAEKYQGSFTFDVKDSRFIADVMLDLNGEKQEE